MAASAHAEHGLNAKATLLFRAARGDHIRSSWPTPAHCRFGTAERDASEKVYLGRELANTGYGR